LCVSEQISAICDRHNCFHWKGIKSDDILRDLYDGRVWKENIDFFKNGGIGLILNIDWYQPFSSSKYSVGVMYLALMNLPREKRYKKENMVIAGVIPGPSEPDVSFKKEN
jgi:hypothetical protein